MSACLSLLQRVGWYLYQLLDRACVIRLFVALLCWFIISVGVLLAVLVPLGCIQELLQSPGAVVWAQIIVGGTLVLLTLKSEGLERALATGATFLLLVNMASAPAVTGGVLLVIALVLAAGRANRSLKGGGS